MASALASGASGTGSTPVRRTKFIISLIETGSPAQQARKAGGIPPEGFECRAGDSCQAY